MVDISAETPHRDDAEKRVKATPIRSDWISKSLAGALLGLSLAFFASGILAAVLPVMPLPVSGQLVMWLVPPVWLCVLSLVYFFASGTRAWLGLGAANALALAVWWLLQPGNLA